MVLFKIYDVATWSTNNYNTHITQYHTKVREPGNEICSVKQYNRRNIFLRKSCRKWGRKPKASGLQLYFNIILIALNLAYNKNKQHKTLDYWSKYMLSFDFLENSLGKVATPHSVYDFWRKMLLMLHFINWLNFIAYCDWFFPRLWRQKFRK